MIFVWTLLSLISVFRIPPCIPSHFVLREGQVKGLFTWGSSNSCSCRALTAYVVHTERFWQRRLIFVCVCVWNWWTFFNLIYKFISVKLMTHHCTLNGEWSMWHRRYDELLECLCHRCESKQSMWSSTQGCHGDGVSSHWLVYSHWCCRILCNRRRTAPALQPPRLHVNCSIG